MILDILYTTNGINSSIQFIINSFVLGRGRKCIDKQEGIYKDRKCILMTEFEIFKWEGIYEAPQQIAHVMWHDNFHY